MQTETTVQEDPKTLITLEMPQHAVDKIMADPEAFLAHMREKGIEAISVERTPDKV